MRISKKWLFVLVAVMVVAGATVAYAQTQTFSDVPPSNPHYDGIEWAYENGVTVGYADGTYRPWEPVNRGQMATFLNRFYDNLVAPIADGGGEAGLAGCAECHDASNTISGRQAQWGLSGHGMGEAFLRGSSASCAGCHSGGAFQDMVAAGLNPGDLTSGDSNVGRQDCRACHQIHETGTSADWALETTAPVNFYADGLTDYTFDGGAGNLCANCHQPRRTFPGVPADSGWTDGDPIPGGVVSTHWGPHHGPQSAMLMGLAGAGVDMPFSETFHYGVNNTCVSCHVVGSASHTFEWGGSSVDAANCAPCHSSVPDPEAVQTAVQTRLDAIGDALVAAGLLNENTPDGHPTQDVIDNGCTYDEGVALWNWIYMAHEDSSLGIHNPGYYDALLTASEDALGI